MPVKVQQKNLYEATVIIKPDLSNDDLNKVVDQIQATIKSFGGDILNVIEPSLKKFTHRIKTVRDGYYVTFIFNSPPELPTTLKKSLLIMDEVLRHMVLRKESLK